LGLDESDESDWEEESVASTESESDTTVVYQNSVWQDLACDEDGQSDVETIVGDWEDPFLTPHRVRLADDLFDDEEEDPFYLPDDLEEGLEHLG
jgi:hypothetical protein